MKSRTSMLMLSGLLLAAVTAHSDEYVDTIAVFKESPGSALFFDKAYGYAVFPTIGKAGLVVGGAHGTGRVFEKGLYVGDTSLTQLSVGFQAGGQAFSEIIFFENKAAFDIFTAGNFEMAGTGQATAITASAPASAGPTGPRATARATH